MLSRDAKSAGARLPKARENEAMATVTRVCGVWRRVSRRGRVIRFVGEFLGAMRTASSQSRSRSAMSCAPIHQTSGWNQKSVSTHMCKTAVRLSRKRTWRSSWARMASNWCGVKLSRMPSGSRSTGRKTPNTPGSRTEGEEKAATDSCSGRGVARRAARWRVRHCRNQRNRSSRPPGQSERLGFEGHRASGERSGTQGRRAIDHASIGRSKPKCMRTRPVQSRGIALRAAAP